MTNASICQGGKIFTAHDIPGSLRFSSINGSLEGGGAPHGNCGVVENMLRRKLCLTSRSHKIITSQITMDSSALSIPSFCDGFMNKQDTISN